MKNKKAFIITGSVILICIIALVAVFTNTGSVATQVSKQLDLGHKYLLEGNYKEAIIAFEKAIQIDPKSVDARLGLSEVYVAANRIEDAIIVLNDAMVINLNRPEPYTNLARIFMLQGDYQKALEILEKGLKNSGDTSIVALLDELKPQTPVASVESGKYTEPVTVKFDGIGEKDEVYYTLNGSEPNKEAIKYDKPIKFGNGKNTIRAITYRNSVIASDEARYEYEIDIPSYVVRFVDKAFEQAIRKLIDKPEGEILNTELFEIEEIDIWGEEIIKRNKFGPDSYDGQEIVSITYSRDWFEINGKNFTTLGMIQRLDDIKHFPNLRDLGIRYQESLDISASKSLASLESLYLTNNQIKDISTIAELLNLKRLDLDNNSLTDISAIKGLTNLEVLSLNDNQLIDISVLKDLNGLKSLNLHYNQISDIAPLKELTNLEYLYLDRNKIDNIEMLKGMKNLKALGLSSNQISDIGVIEGLVDLTQLTINKNQISDISSLLMLKSLSSLYLDTNPIDTTQIEKLKKALPDCRIFY